MELNTTCNESVAVCSSGNASDTDDQLTPAMAEVVSILVPILFGIIIVIGLIGNALVVVVVSANAQMRSTTNLLIINLAVADLLFIIFCVPFTASDYILTYWPFGDVWCRVVQYLIVVTAYASVYTLVLMTVDRFLAVVYPIKSMSVRTERHAVMAIAVLWVLIVTSAVPVYYSHGERHYKFNDEEHIVCVFLDHEYQWAVFQISFFVTSYVLPLALICGLYLGILLRLWRGVAPGGRVSAESRRGKRRVTRMVVVVVATFAICWCPIQLILVLKSLDRYDISAGGIIAQIVSHVLAYMNSCVNPILYAYLSENFRKAFSKEEGRVPLRAQTECLRARRRPSGRRAGADPEPRAPPPQAGRPRTLSAASVGPSTRKMAAACPLSRDTRLPLSARPKKNNFISQCVNNN